VIEHFVMRCVLFTWHGYGTWLPDDPRGFVHRQRGLQRPNPTLASKYRQKQRWPAARFDNAHQRLIVETLRDAAGHLEITIHAVGTESTHVHALVSWWHDRTRESVNRSLRRALSLKLKEAFDDRPWFSQGASMKAVTRSDHFDHLLLRYLPAHRGRCWTREADRVAAHARDKPRVKRVGW